MTDTPATSAARIISIETSVPQHQYTQEQALAFMKAVPSYGNDERAFLDRIYPPSAIGCRYSTIADFGRSPEEYDFFSRSADLLPEPLLEKRNAMYVEAAPRIASEAARKALDAAPGVDAQSVTHIVSASCTGFSAPGVDLAIQRSLGLPASTRRIHIGFMGCYAAVPALRTARDILCADPAAVVLVVCVELCSLHFQLKPDREQMVANSLFADGAAAAVVVNPMRAGDGVETQTGAGAGFDLLDFETALLDDSEQDMAWTIGSIAFDMRLSAYVPKIVQKNIQPVLNTLLGRNRLTQDDLVRWAIHPGGRAVLERVSRGLGFDPPGLEDSYAVLNEYGNMSSPTILFVLRKTMEALRQNAQPGPVVAAAFGPGLTVESALMAYTEGTEH